MQSDNQPAIESKRDARPGFCDRLAAKFIGTPGERGVLVSDPVGCSQQLCIEVPASVHNDQSDRRVQKYRRRTDRGIPSSRDPWLN